MLRRAQASRIEAMSEAPTQDAADEAGMIQRMQIFRAADARGLVESGCLTVEPGTEVQAAGMGRIMAAGLGDGDDVQVLVNMPGFSLTHAWFKHGYPLPLHSHDADCMYYIVRGSLRLGTEELGPRDCFFIPANVPYTYKPGPDGVEVLEIRHETRFNFVNLVKGGAFWDKALASVEANRDAWKAAQRPN
jgi:mannose-6-phosphate isomerase-like protein (cupin superfamily)